MDTEGTSSPETNKVLSQCDIDLLLNSLAVPEGQETSAAAVSTKNVRPYDFRRPDKFSKEQLRGLQKVHESFARMVASFLSSYLRTGIQFRLTSLEQIIYGEYIQQLQNPTVVNIVSAKPLPEHIIIEINFRLAFPLIDRLLGGTGQVPQKVRDVTDIELALFQTLVGNILASLQEAWAQMSAVTFDLDGVVFDPLTMETALPTDVGVLVLFELQIKDIADTISMFIPYTMLEPIMGKLSQRMWLSRGQRDGATANLEIQRQLEKVEVPVIVNLGTATVSVRELLGLQKGDVVRLDTSANQELEVLVGGEHKFSARPGRVGRRLAVAITQVLPDASPERAQSLEAVFGGAG